MTFESCLNHIRIIRLLHFVLIFSYFVLICPVEAVAFEGSLACRAPGGRPGQWPRWDLRRGPRDRGTERCSGAVDAHGKATVARSSRWASSDRHSMRGPCRLGEQFGGSWSTTKDWKRGHETILVLKLVPCNSFSNLSRLSWNLIHLDFMKLKSMQLPMWSC